MRCNNYGHACGQALANSSPDDPWQVFADTNGVWNAERMRKGDTVKGAVFRGPSALPDTKALTHAGGGVHYFED